MTVAAAPNLGSARPFPGLRSFDYADSEWFFGREDQVFALYRLLDGSRFIAVVGSSGSGKSSLVRAGLRPLLDEESRGEGGRSWRWVEVRPGNSPIENLADSLAKLSQDPDEVASGVGAARRGRILNALKESSLGFIEAMQLIDGLEQQTIVLMVDQFEELFRYGVAGSDAAHRRVANARWRDEAAQFVQLLQEASRDREKRVHVLITLRSDFVGECAQFHGLPEMVSATQYLVPSLTRDQRQEVICGPVEKAGGSIEPALLQLLLNDATDEVDQLPVLQHCLMRLWNRAGEEAAAAGSDNVALTTEQYEHVGRLSGALSKHADEVMGSLEGQALDIELVFRALAETDAEGRAIRRPVAFAQLAAETGIAEDSLRRVIDRFRADDCSFVAPSASSTPSVGPETIVDVGHEALLRRWEKISARRSESVEGGDIDRGWLVAEEDDARVYRGLLALAEIGLRSRLEDVEQRWNWWLKPGHTPAWTDKYGGGFGRVQALLDYNRSQVEEDERRVVRAARNLRNLRIGVALAAAFALITLSLWSRNSYIARMNAEDERDRLFTQIETIVFGLSDQLRLVPEGRSAVLTVRDEVKRLAVNERRAQKPQDIPLLRASGTREVVNGLYYIMLSQVRKALDSYNKVIQPLEKSSDACSLDLLQAQARIDRAQAELTADNVRKALADDMKARALILDVPVRIARARRSLFPTEAERDCLRVLEDRPLQIFQMEAQAVAGAISVETLLGQFPRARADLKRLQLEISDATARPTVVQEAGRRLIFDLRGWRSVRPNDRRRNSRSGAANQQTNVTFWKSEDAQREQRLGELEKADNDPKEATDAFNGAITKYQAIVASDEFVSATKFSSYQVQLSFVGYEWADAVFAGPPSRSQGIASARQRMDHALGYFSNLHDNDPSNSYWLTVVGRIEKSLGDEDARTKEFEKARIDYGKAIDQFRRVGQLDSANLRSDRERADAEHARAQVETKLNQAAAARADELQSLVDAKKSGL